MLPIEQLSRAEKLRMMEALWDDLSCDELSLSSPADLRVKSLHWVSKIFNHGGHGGTVNSMIKDHAFVLRHAAVVNAFQA